MGGAGARAAGGDAVARVRGSVAGRGANSGGEEDRRAAVFRIVVCTASSEELEREVLSDLEREKRRRHTK